MWVSWHSRLYFPVHRLSRLCVGSGTGRLSGGLGGLARPPLSALALVASGSVLPGLPQSSLPTSTSQVSLLLSLLQRCFRSADFAVILSVTSIGQSTLSPGFLQQRPRISVSAGPFGAARNHNPTRTATIFICVDSFIRLLTAKHQMLIQSLVSRSWYNSQFWSQSQQPGNWLAPPAEAAI